jgi:hypothetical protein
MKATFNGMYRKKITGTLMFTYVVSGTSEEIETYKAIKEAQANYPVGTWPEVNGKPLYYLNPNLISQSGGQPRPQYNLLFNLDKTQVILDESQDILQHYQEVRKASVQAEAQIAAELRLGIRTIERRAATFNVPKQPVLPEATPKVETMLEHVSEAVEDAVQEQLHD